MVFAGPLSNLRAAGLAAVASTTVGPVTVFKAGQKTPVDISLDGASGHTYALCRG